MAPTLWRNVITGEWLDAAALCELRRTAHRAYAANPHLFEDEYDVLVALGAVPAAQLDADGALLTAMAPALALALA